MKFLWTLIIARSGILMEMRSYPWLLIIWMKYFWKLETNKSWSLIRRVCKVRTQDPENLDEEVKSLVSAWRFSVSSLFSFSNFNSLFYIHLFEGAIDMRGTLLTPWRWDTYLIEDKRAGLESWKRRLLRGPALTNQIQK